MAGEADGSQASLSPLDRRRQVQALAGMCQSFLCIPAHSVQARLLFLIWGVVFFVLNPTHPLTCYCSDGGWTACPHTHTPPYCIVLLATKKTLAAAIDDCSGSRGKEPQGVCRRDQSQTGQHPLSLAGGSCAQGRSEAREGRVCASRCNEAVAVVGRSGSNWCRPC